MYGRLAIKGRCLSLSRDGTDDGGAFGSGNQRRAECPFSDVMNATAAPEYASPSPDAQYGMSLARYDWPIARPLRGVYFHTTRCAVSEMVPPNRLSRVGRPWQRLGTQTVIVLVTAIVTSFICRWYYMNSVTSDSGRQGNSAIAIDRASSELAVADMKEYTMRHHYTNQPAAIHVVEEGRTDGPLDNCKMLRDCFPGASSIYNSHDECARNMQLILRHYDSSIVIHRNRTVGFISFHVEVNPNDRRQQAVNIYNVCIHPAHRGRGLAKRLLAEGLEALMDHRQLRDKQILLALDVDLTSSMAAESFSMYVKLGYLRAWQACRSVADVDWRPLFRDPEAPAVANTLPVMLANLSRYVEEEVKGQKPRAHLPSRTGSSDPLDHFCMFKFYNEDWLSIGRALASPYRPGEGEKNKEP